MNQWQRAVEAAANGIYKQRYPRAQGLLSGPEHPSHGSFYRDATAALKAALPVLFEPRDEERQSAVNVALLALHLHRQGLEAEADE